MKRHPFLLFAAALFVLLGSCKTVPPPNQPKPAEPAEKVVKKESVQPAPVKNTPKETKKEFTLDKDTYKKTKEDIAVLINTLNKIIENRDYESWLSYLSRDYYDYYSDPKVLAEQSKSPLLEKYNIVLRSLKDYFNYVVVGSRKNVRLDEIKAIDENHIKAYMVIDSTPFIIYELIKIDGKWKIAHF